MHTYENLCIQLLALVASERGWNQKQKSVKMWQHGRQKEWSILRSCVDLEHLRRIIFIFNFIAFCIVKKFGFLRDWLQGGGGGGGGGSCASVLLVCQLGMSFVALDLSGAQGPVETTQHKKPGPLLPYVTRRAVRGCWGGGEGIWLG